MIFSILEIWDNNFSVCWEFSLIVPSSTRNVNFNEFQPISFTWQSSLTLWSSSEFGATIYLSCPSSIWLAKQKNTKIRLGLEIPVQCVKQCAIEFENSISKMSCFKERQVWFKTTPWFGSQGISINQVCLSRTWHLKARIVKSMKCWLTHFNYLLCSNLPWCFDKAASSNKWFNHKNKNKT